MTDAEVNSGLQDNHDHDNLDPDGDAVTPTIVTPPLLRLPTEMLALILQEFALPLSRRRADFDPHWKCSVIDASALRPVAQTCRRLREVVMSLPPIVKTVIISEDTPFDTDKMQAVSKDIPLNVYISFVHRTPQEVRDWYMAEAHRIQELHLTRLANLNMDSWVPLLALLAPKLRFFSIATSGVAWLPPKGSLLSLPQASHLRHLTLRKVCFLPRNHFPFLTHLALIDVRLPRFDKTFLAFLSRCPNLESLVLDHSQESIMERPVSTMRLHLPHLQRVTLERPDKDGLYLMSIPHNRCMALQLLSPNVKSDVARLILPKFSPDPHTLRIVHLEPPRVYKEISDPGSWRSLYGEWSSASLTSVGPTGTFHVRCTSPSEIEGPHYEAQRAMLEDKSALASVRTLWLVGMQATRPIKDTDTPTMTIPWAEFRLVGYMSFVHRVAIAMRDLIVGLSALETLVYILPHTLEPNLWILPNTTHRLFASRCLKTLKLVICHGIGLRTSETVKRPELKLGK
ncbi:hypothetical protein L226DRAFT_560987, partial [Lentinus tigrinus ALCF2SS1-7]